MKKIGVHTLKLSFEPLFETEGFILDKDKLNLNEINEIDGRIEMIYNLKHKEDNIEFTLSLNDKDLLEKIIINGNLYQTHHGHKKEYTLEKLIEETTNFLKDVNTNYPKPEIKADEKDIVKNEPVNDLLDKAYVRSLEVENEKLHDELNDLEQHFNELQEEYEDLKALVERLLFKLYF